MFTANLPKKKSVFRIVKKDEHGNDIFVTVAYPHKSGGGHSFKIGADWYYAFPVKEKTVTETTEEGA